MAFSIHVLDSVNNVNVPRTVSAYRYCYLGQVITKSNKNINVTAKKMLARLMFDLGVVNTTDNDCDQQVPSVALRLQH